MEELRTDPFATCAPGCTRGCAPFSLGKRRNPHDTLSGFRCPACGEIEFDAASAECDATASEALVLAKWRVVGDELRRIRKKLYQTEAPCLTFQWQFGLLKPSLPRAD